jgi:PadR family transcriptional regulator, regulatory protein PadR
LTSVAHFIYYVEQINQGHAVEINLGELEQLVILALLRLGDDAYGVTVQATLAERTGRSPALATVYTTLARLEAKGIVVSHLGAATPERGGRAKKHFRVTTAGRTALKRSFADMRSLAQGLGGSWSTP